MFRDSDYPSFGASDLQWFTQRVESIAGDSQLVEGIYRRKAGLELEMVLRINRKAWAKFPPRVCLQLARELGHRVGVLRPVVYLEGNPHSEAQEALDYAARGGV